MANGFSTGVSAKPIDLTSGARSFMKSAVEARINEIASNKERISKDNEMLLKALSVKALPTLAREQRDRYAKEIEDYRGRLIDKWKTSGKNLTSRDQMEIEDGFMDLQTRMASEVNELKQYDEAQKLMLDPNFQYAYDPVKYEQVMKEAYSNMMAGKGIGNLNAKLFSAQLAPSPGDYMSKRYGDQIKALDEYKLGDIKGNIFTETQYQGLALENNPNLTPIQKKGIEKAQRLRADMSVDPYFKRNYQAGGAPDEAKINQVITDFISPVRQDVSKVSTGRSGSGGGSGAQKQELYPTTVTTSRGQETWYNFPKGVPQATGTMMVEDAYDAETGDPVKVDKTVDYRVVGFSPDSRRVIVETGGGVKKAGGSPLLYDPKNDALAEDPETSDSLTKRAKDMLAARAKDKGKWSSVSGAEVVDNGDGTDKLVGTLERPAKKGVFGMGKEEAVTEYVEIPLLPVTDDKTVRRLELDLDEYRGAISPLEKGWNIGNESVTSIIDSRKTKKKGDSLNLGF